MNREIKTNQGNVSTIGFMMIDFNRPHLAIFASYYRPHLLLFAADMLCALLTAAVDLAFPMMTKYTIDRLLPQGLYPFFFVMIGLMLLLYVLRIVVLLK